jgi:hypothetical protein
MAELDIAFYVDADTSTGLGHLSRCMKVANLIRARLPQARVALRGKFTERAMTRIRADAADLNIKPFDGDERARVGVIDRMANPDDIEAVDPEYNQRVSRLCERVVFVASGQTVPATPSNAIVVGYHPGGPASMSERVRWSLDYAPVELVNLVGGPSRDPSRLLLALGAWSSPQPIHSALAAVRLLDWVRIVDVLVSPLSDIPTVTTKAGTAEIRLHRNVPDVAPLILSAGLAVISAGNLGYEAMALGTPVCLVGLKPFQVRIAAALHSRNVAINGGDIRETSTWALVAAIGLTRTRGEALAREAKRCVPRDGLSRLAKTIMEHGEIA